MGFMKKIFLLFLILFSSLKGCEVGNTFDKRLFYDDINEVQAAINEGADVNAKDESDFTALYLLLCYNREEIVELLIKSGANLNSQVRYGNTALMSAVNNNRLEMTKLLIDAGANINIQDQERAVQH